MDEREDSTITRLEKAYARVRRCADIRRHELDRNLEELDRIERDALAAHDERMQQRSN